VVRANKAVWELWNKELDISDTRTLEQYLIDQGVSDEGRALIEAGYSNTLCSTSDRLPIYGMHCIELQPLNHVDVSSNDDDDDGGGGGGRCYSS
jgi:hypothetical protein